MMRDEEPTIEVIPRPGHVAPDLNPVEIGIDNEWVDPPGPTTLKEWSREFIGHLGEFILIVWAFLLDGLKAALVFMIFIGVELLVFVTSDIYESIVGDLGPITSELLNVLKGGIFLVGALTVGWILAVGALNVGYAASRTTAFYSLLRKLKNRKSRPPGNTQPNKSATS